MVYGYYNELNRYYGPVSTERIEFDAGTKMDVWYRR